MSFWKTLGKAVATAVAVAAIVYTGGAALGISSITAVSFTTYVTGAAVMAAASTAVGSALAPKAPSLGEAIRGQLVTTRVASDPARIVYGKTRIGGNIVFLETTGANNEVLYQVSAVAGHELNSLVSVYANDELLILANQGTYYTTTYKNSASALEFAWFPGTTAQSANAILSATAAAAYQFKGLAALVAKFTYNQDVFPQGIPNITVVVEGKKVYDPRSTLTAYSNNAALCIRDYLTDTTYGLGVTATELDEASFIAAANICDQNVSLAAGGTEKRYAVNGAFSSNLSPKDVIDRMLTSCGGKLSYSGGKWTLKVAAYSAPSVTITESMLVGPIEVQATLSKRDIFNAIKGTFSDPNVLYQPTSFPAIENGTYETEDGEKIWRDVEYPFTTSSATCQRLAKIELERARQQISAVITCNLKAFSIQPGDTVNLTLPRYGWSNKIFEVYSWEFGVTDSDTGPTPTVTMLVRETAAAIYDWNSGEETEIDYAPNTNLPNPFSVPAPTTLTITEVSTIVPDGATQTGMLVEWTAPASPFIFQYEVQWRRASGFLDYGLVTNSATTTDNYGLITATADVTEDFGSIATSPIAADPSFNSVIVNGTQYTIPAIIPDIEYTVRVRAINSLDIRSPFISTTTTPQPDTTPPSNITSPIATAGFKQIALSWVNPFDADLDYVEIWRNNTNNLSGATKIAVTRASAYNDAGLGINQTWYYWLRPLDRTGNAGNFTSSVNATTLFIDTPDFSAAVNNLFTEAGAYGIEPVASLPVSGDFDGQIKYNTTSNKLYRWDATNSVWTDDIFSITAGSVDLASFASGIEPVSIVNSLPSPSGYTGAKVVFLTTDNKLYRYTGTAWTSAVAAGDLSGAIASTNFPSDLRPIEIVNTLPTSGVFAGRTVFLTTDNKIYRHDGVQFTAAVPTTDLSGTVSNAQIASLAATKVTGQITSTQIEDNAISSPKIAAGAVIAGKIAAGSVEADKIAASAVSADKIAAGAVTAGKIATDAVEAGKIAAGAVSADKIAANAITSDKIAAGAITAGKLAVGAVEADAIAANVITAGKIAAGAIGTDQLAANAVVAAKIAAGTITTDKIAAGTIQGSRIAANTITGGLIAASGIITSAAQIDNGVISNANIANAAITNAKIQDGTILSAKIGTGEIKSANIGTAEVGTLKIASEAVIVPVSAYTSSTLTGMSTTKTEIQTATITIDVQTKIIVMAGFMAASVTPSGEFAACQIYLERDGTLIYYTQVGLTVFGGGSAPVNIFTDQTLNSGTYVFKLYVGPPTTNINKVASLKDRNILLLGAKR